MQKIVWGRQISGFLVISKPMIMRELQVFVRLTFWIVMVLPAGLQGQRGNTPALHQVPPRADKLSKYDIKAAVTAEKKTAEYHYQVGAGGLDQGYLGMADRHLSKAIALKKDLAFAWCERGWVHWHQNRCDKALPDFDEALRLNPFIENAWQGRALVYKDQWKLTLADADITHLLALDAEDTLAYWLRGQLRFARGETYEAIKDFSAAADRDSLEKLYQIDLAYAMLSQGLTSMADAKFIRLKDNPVYGYEAERGHLLCLLKAGKKEEASLYAESNYGIPWLQAWLKSILAHENGETGKAQELEEVMLEKMSKMGFLNYTSGYYALQRGDREIANSRLLKALKYGDLHIRILARMEIEKGGFKIPANMKY